MADFWTSVGTVIAGITIGFALLATSCGMFAMLLEEWRSDNVR